MSEIIGYIIIVSFFWFTIYWIVGGLVFAMVALFNMIKLRRARFSCLFTLSSAICAFGAAYSGAYSANASIQLCIEQSGNDFFNELASVIACGILEQTAAGVIWFLILFGLGLTSLALSRATNQSWMDSNERLPDGDRGDFIEM